MQPRRARPGEGLCRLQGGRRAPGRADGHPGQDHQGLRPGRGGRRPQHHAPAEEAQRGGAARVPQPLRHPDLRRRGRPTPRSTGRPTTARRCSTCASAARALGGFVPQRGVRVARRSSRRTGSCSPSSSPAARGARSRPRWPSCGCWRSCCATRARPAGRADRARRGAHLRHGGALPPVRHLLARRPALRAGRPRHRALLPRGDATGRSSRKASPRPARCRRSSPPAPPTPTHGVSMIPFFIYYSMFGFQRIGDLIWAAGDMRAGASCSAARPAAPRWPARGCSTRTATATSSRCRCRTCGPTTRPTPTRWR